MDRQERATGTLIAEAVDGLAGILRGEIALARAEASEAVRKVASGAGFLVAGAVVAVVGLNTLAAAAVAGLISLGLSPWIAAVVAGGILLLVAAAMAQFGLAQFRPEALRPRRLIRSLRLDAGHLDGSIRHAHE